jgi:hypothetical protein
LVAAILQSAVDHTHHSSHTDSHEVQVYCGSEPVTINRIALHDRLAQEIRKIGIDCSALPLNSHQLERAETYYSYGFALTSRLVTNKGLIEIKGKNVDFVHVLQRN